MKLTRLSILAVAALSAAGVQATSVIPPSFDELVGRAQLIMQGTVQNVRSEWNGEGAQRHIQTYVTVQVEDVLKGQATGSYTLSMLGGTVDGQTMEVTDMPKFKVGDHDILFVENNGKQYMPLVGIMHGRFRIQRDQQSGRDIVTGHDGRAVTDLTTLGKAEQASASNKAALTVADFKAAIHDKIRTGSVTASEQ